VLLEWGYEPIEKKKRRLHDLLDAIALLRSGGVHGAGVIKAYHTMGVAPLMAHTLSLYEVMPDVPLEGTVLAEGPYRNSDIEQRIREVMDVLDNMFKFSILGHPAMCPDVGFIDLVGLFLVFFSWSTLHCHLILRTIIRSLSSLSRPPVCHC
jgi:hypothetical protein